MSHPTEREAEEAIGRDLARRIAPLEPVLTTIPILHGILLGKRPNLFLFLFLLASAFYWYKDDDVALIAFSFDAVCSLLGGLRRRYFKNSSF